MNERTSEDIRAALLQPGFTPKIDQAERLMPLLGDPDETVADAAEHALERMGPRAAKVGIERFSELSLDARLRMVAAVGRLARQFDELLPWLRERAGNPEGRIRRRAMRALGQTSDTQAEPLLIERWQAADVVEKRAIVRALGNVGTENALRHLREQTTDDPELIRLLREAIQKIERSLSRDTTSAIDPSVSRARRTTVLVHVRAGLESMTIGELGERLDPKVTGPGRVRVTLDEPLETLFRSRTMLHFGFPLHPISLGAMSSDALVEAAARAIAGDEARGIFDTWTRGTVRYRIEWSGGGHRRAATFQVAERVSRQRPELVNDPRQATWEVVVSERGEPSPALFVELWPRALVDPRFSYRVRTVPASSHPTIAAALALIGGAVPDDVVWDPFVGAAAELVERARLGPYRRMFGSDTDEAAREAACVNLAEAKVERVSVVAGDATTYRPEMPVSLILTNPPMGRRVLDRESVRRLLESFVGVAADVLAPNGRLVWISPLPEMTASAAAEHGLAVNLRQRVDMGGFFAEVQRFERAPRKSARSAPAKAGPRSSPKPARAKSRGR